MTSEKNPLLACRKKRKSVFIGEQVSHCDMCGMGDGLVCSIDGNLYYNMILIGQETGRNIGQMIRFGNKVVMPWSRNIVDLTYQPKGLVSAVENLPVNPTEGDVYVVNQEDPEIRFHYYAYEEGDWADKGPVTQSLEASVKIDNLQAEFLCGTYQGEEAEWNTIRSWAPNVDFQKLFQVGDAVTIEGCVTQPWNNQTLIVREIEKHELRFYENSFKQAYLGRMEWYPDDFSFPQETVFRIIGEELPIYGHNAFFTLDSAILNNHTLDDDTPDVALFYKPATWSPDAPLNPIVQFYHWNQQNNTYEFYGSVTVIDRDLNDPTNTITEYIDLRFEKLDEHPNAGNEASNAKNHYYENKITISRKWPKGIQGVFAASNRLWGWVGHQLRASKLGDPSNWDFFDGTAEDSWAVDVRDSDPFTGGSSVHGYPTFFTENKRYRIYGSEPEAYQLGEQDCNGVRAGCAKSMVAFDGALYYVSRIGVMQDTGASPVCVSEALGLLQLFDAVGGGHQKRYYVTGTDQTGKRHNLVLDTRNGVWIDEGHQRIDSYAAAAGVMHEAVLSGQNEDALTIWARETGSPLGSGTAEGEISSEVVTNDYTMAQPNRKRVHRVQLRYVIGNGGSLTVFIQYDNDGIWHTVKRMSGLGEKKSVYLPVIPRRCDHFRLRFVGIGEWELHSLALDLRQSSAMF